jgi:hypothetical protein
MNGNPPWYDEGDVSDGNPLRDEEESEAGE